MKNFLQSFLLAVFGCFIANPKAEFFWVTKDAMCFHDEHHAILHQKEIGGEYWKITRKELEEQIKALKDAEQAKAIELAKTQKEASEEAKVIANTTKSKSTKTKEVIAEVEEDSKSEQA